MAIVMPQTMFAFKENQRNLSNIQSNEKIRNSSAIDGTFSLSILLIYGILF